MYRSLDCRYTIFDHRFQRAIFLRQIWIVSMDLMGSHWNCMVVFLGSFDRSLDSAIFKKARGEISHSKHPGRQMDPSSARSGFLQAPGVGKWHQAMKERTKKLKGQ